MLAYLAAVGTLAWQAVYGDLGDLYFGFLTIQLMAFPVSVPTILGHSWLERLFLGAGDAGPVPGGEFLLMVLPGVIAGVLLGVLLTRWRRLGSILGSIPALLVIGAGLVNTFEGWPPSRFHGWPFFVYGAIMIVGLIANVRAHKQGVTRKIVPEG
ncbi:hypothetical protein [Rhizohabitans arisaemae]|uniref:hypothetical protein n=1 Tax=Rhizohabitans arisaemae TaxID=2720610 RepID=UPI0024B0F07F|nr:hypothetical protein [Rhizohabitans arisaemae]